LELIGSGIRRATGRFRFSFSFSFFPALPDPVSAEDDESTTLIFCMPFTNAVSAAGPAPRTAKANPAGWREAAPTETKTKTPKRKRPTKTKTSNENRSRSRRSFWLEVYLTAPFPARG
jgi:hypothetical protein